MSIQTKIALVTGASRGIGKAIAEDLSSLNIPVIGTATTEKGAEDISNYLAIANAPQGSKGMVLDVTDIASVEHLFADMADTCGLPTILINNAGITADNLMLRLSDIDWDRVIDTNLSSAFRLIKGSLRHMIKQKWGRIVNISSVIGSIGNAGQANYAAAKAGLNALTKSIAHEVAARGITVNNIAPGFIQTDMTNKMNEEQQNNIIDRVPMKRMGQPSDIAKAVQFLVSEGAAYITGETLHINGGMFMS